MLDMVSPQNTSRITLADLVRPDKRMISGVLFDVLFNLHKFLRFESRDPFQEKIRREDIFHSDWDRFAHAEYNRLAQEEEDDNDNSSAGGYDAAMEVDSLLQQQQLQQSAPSLSQDGGSLAQSSDEEDEDDDEDDHGHRVGDQRHHGRGGGHQRSNSGDNWSMINDEESDEDEDEDALLGNRLVQRGRR
jgi:hypothetical protein